MENTKITVETLVKATPEKVWECWTKPEYIIQWNHASDDWHCPIAKNDLTVHGHFSYTMASKDGKMSFDFSGVYTKVIPLETIEIKLDDERELKISFSEEDDFTKVVEIFDAEQTNPIEMQKFGWQAILDNFKRVVEG